MSVILVAEQDAGYAEQIAETLRSEGWAAEIVASRDAAFRAATSNKPSLLLASATLPEASSLLAAFSRQRGGPGAIVLVPEALASRASATDFHADILLPRPCSSDELKGTVRSCLQSTAGAAKPSGIEAQAGGQQLTSADIFGDVLAEVEAEATRARRATSKARRRASSDEIERKLEETLSGVFPVGDKIKPKPPETPAATTADSPAPPPNRPTKKPKRKVELPTESEIDDLLDKTLSSLELPTRGRKTANRPRPEEGSQPAAPLSPSPAPAPQAPTLAAGPVDPQPRPEPQEPSKPPAASAPMSQEPPPPTSSFTAEPPSLAPSAAAAAPAAPAAASNEAPLEPSVFSTTPMNSLGSGTFEIPEVKEAGEETNPWQAPDDLLPPPGEMATDDSELGGSDAFAIDGGDPWSELRGLSSPDSFSRRDDIAAGFNTIETPKVSSPAPSEEPGESTNPWQSIEPPADLFPASFDDTHTGYAPPPQPPAPVVEGTPPPSPTPPAAPVPPAEAAPLVDAPAIAAPPPLESPPPPAPSTSSPGTGTEGDEADSALDRFRSFLDQVDSTPDTDEVSVASTPAAAPPPTEQPAPLPPPDSFAPPTASPPPAPPVAADPPASSGPEAALQGVLELRGEASGSAVTEVSPGQPFGDYTLLERIAVGGMAEVWRARRSGVEGFQKTVAIKKILSHLTDSPDFVNMFIDEAKLAAQLTHNNIIQIYDLGKVEEDFFIAMEFVDGRDLRTILKKSASLEKPLPMPLALMIVAALAKALDYAHRKKGFDDRALGLVHRDVSPQNVLISYEGEIKLCDFGIVKAVAKASTTQMGALKGKLQYMSPEQAWGKSVDARSDIFSLGSVLFEVLTGEKLFIGDSEIGVLDAVRECRIRSLHDMLPDLPTKVDDIVRKALEKNADDRYQTAGDLDRDIQEVLRELQTSGDSKDLAAYMASLFRPSLEAPQMEPMGDGSAVYVPPPATGSAVSMMPSGTGVTGGSKVTAPPPAPAAKPETSQGGLKKILIPLAILLVIAIVAVVALKTMRSDSAPSTPTTQPAPTTPPASAPDTDPQAAAPSDGAAPATTAEGNTTDGASGDPATNGDGSASTDAGADGDELDIESLVQEGLSAQQQEMQERLESEFEAKRRELEAKLAETQQEIDSSEPPPDDP